MENLDLKHYAGLLETEQTKIEEELKEVARVNPKDASDWEAVPAERDETTFRDEVADRMEEFEDREAMVTALEGRLHQVRAASTRIKNGTYGKCTVCQNQIEVERLEANPAAATCKQHLEHV